MKFLTLALASCFAWGPAAFAQQAYPTKPIRLLLGYTPGGAADLIARIVGDAMSRQLGQPVIVENKPGAGSTLSSATLAAAPPDGYTLALATGTLYGIDQFLYKSRYSPSDFTAITRLTVSPLILAVNNDIGVTTVKDLVQYIKAHPGKANYSSSGIGGSPHMGGLIFEKLAKGSAQHIPYKGGAPAIQAVASGEVQFSFGTAASVLPLGQAKAVRMLGVTTLRQSAIAPELPTLSDTGLPGFEFSFWYGLFGPANMPQPIRDKLFAVVTEILKDPQIAVRLVGSGNEPLASASPHEFNEWATLNGQTILERVKAANVKVE